MTCARKLKPGRKRRPPSRTAAVSVLRCTCSCQPDKLLHDEGLLHDLTYRENTLHIVDEKLADDDDPRHQLRAQTGNLLQEIEPVHLRQDHVERYQVVLLILNFFQCLT